MRAFALALDDTQQFGIGSQIRNDIIPLARVRDAFNGTSGDENPVEYIGEDGWHTNESGAARIAELHRELGYAPLA